MHVFIILTLWRKQPICYAGSPDNYFELVSWPINTNNPNTAGIYLLKGNNRNTIQQGVKYVQS